GLETINESIGAAAELPARQASRSRLVGRDVGKGRQGCGDAPDRPRRRSYPLRHRGPDGPLYANFHALRHTYLTLGGRAGIDLRTLQELAGHSTPDLTARYSHRRLYDLAGAVERLPSFLPRSDQEPALAATGTEGKSTTPEVVSLRSACASDEEQCGFPRT